MWWMIIQLASLLQHRHAQVFCQLKPVTDPTVLVGSIYLIEVSSSGTHVTATFAALLQIKAFSTVQSFYGSRQLQGGLLLLSQCWLVFLVICWTVLIAAA